MSGRLLTIEVAYALAQEQAVVQLKVEPGATLRQAIEASGIRARYPEINLATMRIGVFGRLRGLEEPVNAGERIEIYRPLSADPKEMRRSRAARNKL